MAAARWVVTMAVAFLCLFLVVGEDGEPGGALFALGLVFVLADRAGACVAALDVGVPPLLGMLVAGFLLRNLPYIGERVGGRVDEQWSSAIRLLALTLILSRAGLALDIEALRRLRFAVLRLAFIPCLCEASAVAGMAAVLLDFPAPWAAMLGFLVAAISPAVVVPSLLALQDQGYGVATGIPTLVVAAAALDDVLAIAGFGICLGFAFREGSDALWLDFARVPLELLGGTAAGFVCALVVVAAQPAPRAVDVEGGGAATPAADLGRAAGFAAMLFAFAVACAFGLKELGSSGASALAVLVLAAASGRGWGPHVAKAVARTYADVWNRVAQPLLFGLVGATVAVKSWEPELVAKGVGMLLCSVIVRCCATYFAVGFRGLRHQEKLFAALAWMPKATVQAALGALALDEARDGREEEMGKEVLAIAVLAILCTAPAGAVVISITGPRLLLHDGGAPKKGAEDAAAAAAAATEGAAKDNAEGQAEEQQVPRQEDEEAVVQNVRAI